MPVPATIFVVVLATIIESLPPKVNDNITLPVVSSLLYFIVELISKLFIPLLVITL
jgi:dolichol kinase